MPDSAIPTTENEYVVLKGNTVAFSKPSAWGCQLRHCPSNSSKGRSQRLKSSLFLEIVAFGFVGLCPRPSDDCALISSYRAPETAMPHQNR
jgi:hypothetical protein